MADEVRETREVQTTETQAGDADVERQVVRQDTAAPGNIVAKRVVWYIIGFIIALLALRVVLLLLGANQGSAFVDFIYGFAGVFALPFEGIFGTPVYGSSMLDTAGLVAIVIYALVGWGLAKLFTLSSNHPEA